MARGSFAYVKRSKSAPESSSGATRPTKGVPKIAESTAATETSAVRIARTPAWRSVSPIQVTAAAASPEIPASGPTEPPKARGSRKVTMDFPKLRT